MKMGRPLMIREGVAGVYSPAFVERLLVAVVPCPSRRVSPGMTPRPLLSAYLYRSGAESGLRSVAGIRPPAFVE